MLSKMKVRISTKSGRVIKGGDELNSFLGMLPDGEHVLAAVSLNEPHSEEEWRKLYFFLRDILHESTETGFTKKELHDVIKNDLLNEMYQADIQEWFHKNDFIYSTTNLTADGWKEYVKRCKEYAMEQFEIYL